MSIWWTLLRLQPQNGVETPNSLSSLDEDPWGTTAFLVAAKRRAGFPDRIAIGPRQGRLCQESSWDPAELEIGRAHV